MGGTVGDRAGKGHTSGIWVYARRFGDGTLVTHGSSSKIFGGSFPKRVWFWLRSIVRDLLVTVSIYFIYLFKEDTITRTYITTELVPILHHIFTEEVRPAPLHGARRN